MEKIIKQLSEKLGRFPSIREKVQNSKFNYVMEFDDGRQFKIKISKN